jgi:alginate O-acetyltransferase complex protein AlgI
VVLAGYYSLNNWRHQKTLLLVSSYLFYSAWNPAFVLLLYFSTVVDWYLAKRIESSINIRSRRLYLVLSLVVNLGLLGYFKYGEFLLNNSIYIFSMFGIEFQPLDLDIILPVGISFYTFQTLSYTLDVYRNKIKTEPSFLNYAMYVSFFPQLVAGPIVRAGDFLPQCNVPRRANSDQFGWGLSLIVIGLFMKIIMADTIFAPVVDQVYSNPAHAGRIETWAAIFAFSGQIFCDFSGYSTCAIGIALCFGFILPDNFNVPYAAIGFRDFWHRWHMSLSSWLRDYLYISLGGNRISVIRTYINVMITMLIGGLWHGASWLFVIWGGLHGIYLVIENLIKRNFKGITEISAVTQVLIILLTYLIVSITWIFFRAQNLDEVQLIFSSLFGNNNTGILTIHDFNIVLIASFMILAWQIFRRNITLEDIFSRLPFLLRSAVLFSMLLTIYLFAGGDDRAFIYFQF